MTLRTSIQVHLWRLVLFCMLLTACGGPAQPVASPSSVVASGEATLAQETRAEEQPRDPEPEPGTALSVTREDPSWGDPLAPVTLVIWGDYECPFTARTMVMLPVLLEHYGPKKLRLVWKHKPLPFHKNARPTHIAAETVFRLRGADAFWDFHWQAFSEQRALTRENLISWATMVGVDPKAFRDAFDEQSFARKIDTDLELGKAVGVFGTPTTFVNGVRVDGAQSLETFQSVIDDELGAAKALGLEGVPRERIYALRSDRNMASSIRARPKPSTQPARGSQSVAGLFGAKHILLMYVGSLRALPQVTRSKDEARALAESIVKRARAGEDFNALAWQFTDEPNGASRNGDLGRFPKGTMVPEFEKALEALKVGEISGVVETRFGFHVILRTQ